MNRRQRTAVITGAAIAVVIGAGVAIAAVALPAHPHTTSADRATTAAAHGSATPTAAATPRPETTASAPAPAPTSGAAPSAPAPTASASASASPGAGTGTGTRPSSRSVTPFVSYTQVVSPTSIQVGASIAGIVESTGHCTVTATRGAVTVSGTFAADAQPSSTQCGSMTLSSTKFSSGTWSVVVSYSSPTAHGTSTASAVTL